MGEILVQIAGLPVSDRLRLVQEILKTISADTVSDVDLGLSRGQKEELDRRWAAIQNGTAKTSSWESIETKLNARYGLSN